MSNAYGKVNVYGKIGQASMSGLHNVVVHEGLTFSYSRTIMPMSLQKVYMSMCLQKVCLHVHELTKGLHVHELTKAGMWTT